jgi:hypothetical protein
MLCCSSTGGTPNLENATFLHRRFLTKQCIFDLISEYDGQIYGEYNDNAKGIYYKVVPHYEKVLSNVRKGIKNDLLTNNVTKLALRLKNNPSTLLDLPPIIIVNGGFHDGSHRLSALHLLSEHLDKENFRWSKFRLNVHFYSQAENNA